MYLNIPSIIETIIIIFVVCIVSYFFIRKSLRKKLVWFFRIFVILVLIFLSFEPTFLTFKKDVKPCIAVLVDSSSSMKFDERHNRIKKTIEDNRSSFKNNTLPVFYTFSSNARLLDEKELMRSKPDGNITDIANSLNEVMRSEKRKIDSLLLFSDGQHNNEGSDVLGVVKTLNVPVYTVYPEDKGELVDISITDVRASDYAYKNVPVDIIAVINFYGLVGRDITVFLKKDKDVIASRKIKVKDRIEEVNFSFIPAKLGLATYTVEVPPHRGERITINNRYKFSVEVVREKIRILYICGQINPEYYFLRYFLKSDPSVELVSFVILRNAENIVFVPDSELALIPFPVHEIFSRDLFDYDILIFENFSPARFRVVPPYLKNVSRFISENGGGFLVIAGDNAFGKGGYKGTAIENVLPVALDESSEPIVEGFFNIRIMDYAHPLTMLGDDIRESKRMWAELPQLDSCQQLRPKKGAKVIAVHPWERTGSGNLVAIACCEYGKGRTVAMGVNTTWRWALGETGKVDTGKYYSIFWRNVFKWLSQSEETKPFRISVVQKKYYIEDKIELRLILLDDLLKSCKPILTVVDPYIKRHKIDSFQRTDFGWKAEFVPEVDGKYVFNAKLIRSNKVVADDKKTVVVNVSPSREDYDLHLNRELMNSIAKISSGESFKLSEFSIDKILPHLNELKHPVIKKRADIWNNPLIYILVVLILIAEWTIRRIKGML